MLAGRPAIIYARLSDDAMGEAEAVTKRQLPDCRDYCEANGLEVIEELVDNDLSASRYGRRRRPQYQRGLRLLEEGRADVVVTWHLDRLYRQPKELEQLVDLAQGDRRIEIRTLNGDYDLTNEDHLVMARFMVSMAAKESGDKSRRLKRKHLQLAQEGKPKGGGRGFGYDHECRVIPSEAVAIRHAAERILDGYSVRSVVREWNSSGVLTPKGNLWGGQTVRRSLMGARLAGLREHKGVIVAEAVWEPILDRATWERLRATLADPARTTNGGVIARRWPYSGIVLCGICGRKLKVGVTNRKTAMGCRKDAYPGSCGRLTVVLEPLAELIREAAFQVVLNAPSVVAEVSREDESGHAGAVAELEAIRSKIARLEEDFYLNDSRLSRARYHHLRESLEQRSDKLTASLVVSSPTNAVHHDLPLTLEGLRQAWDARGLDWQRALLHLVYRSITVNPAEHKGQRFTPDRVRLQFQDAIGA